MSNIKTFTDWIGEAKRPTWKDSDAPDANGKFRDLGIKALAKWLISSRKGDMRKITGSLNQQIVFNGGDNQAYAKKLEKVRESVKPKLKKNEGFNPEQWDTNQTKHINKSQSQISKSMLPCKNHPKAKQPANEIKATLYCDIWQEKPI